MIRINLKPPEKVPEILIKIELILWAILVMMPVASLFGPRSGIKREARKDSVDGFIALGQPKPDGLYPVQTGCGRTGLPCP